MTGILSEKQLQDLRATFNQRDAFDPEAKKKRQEMYEVHERMVQNSIRQGDVKKFEALGLLPLFI